MKKRLTTKTKTPDDLCVVGLDRELCWKDGLEARQQRRLRLRQRRRVRRGQGPVSDGQVRSVRAGQGLHALPRRARQVLLHGSAAGRGHLLSVCAGRLQQAIQSALSAGRSAERRRQARCHRQHPARGRGRTAADLHARRRLG